MKYTQQVTAGTYTADTGGGKPNTRGWGRRGRSGFGLPSATHNPSTNHKKVMQRV